MATNFSRRQSTTNVPSARTLPGEVMLQPKGVDLVNPHDLVDDGRSPFAENFRLYESGSDTRRVAVTSRSGSSPYMSPLNESIGFETSKEPSSILSLGKVINTKIQKLSIDNYGLLTRLDAKIFGTEATGPIRADVYSGGDIPTELLAESSCSVVPSDGSGWAKFIFIDAPELEAGKTYWVVFYIQDDGDGEYKVITTASPDTLYTSNGGINVLTEENSSIIYKLYTTPKAEFKGAYRFNQEGADNKTVVVYGTTLYLLDPINNQYLPIETNLSDQAIEYDFTVMDGKLFWVNGFDNLRAWNGILNPTTNIVTNGRFDTNTTGWSSTNSSTLARDTADYSSAPASLRVTGNHRGTDYPVTIEKGRKYKYSVMIKMDSSASMSFETVNQVGGTFQEQIIKETITGGSWIKKEGYFTPTKDTKGIRFYSPGSNFRIDDISIIDTGLETIKDDQLPILNMVESHANRIWGVQADDTNKIVFSEAPGNPSNNTAREQWYYQWLSVSFVYVPLPKAQDPIRSIISFQDNLVVFTDTGKYNIYGTDRSNLQMRQAVSTQGAINNRGTMVHRNILFFVGTDGLYSYDGAKDTNLAALVQPEFDAIPNPRNISVAAFDRLIRFYYPGDGKAYNNRALLYHTDYKEVLMDTGMNVDMAVAFFDGDDNTQLLYFNSLAPMAMMSDDTQSDCGKPIDFEYRLKYNSMDVPAQRKRIKKYFPLFESVDNTFPVNVSMDKDFQNNPITRTLILTANGGVWAGFDWGDDTEWGGNTSFKPKRMRYSGYGYYWQLRISRRAVGNHIAFIGVQYNYKLKRL